MDSENSSFVGLKGIAGPCMSIDFGMRFVNRQQLGVIVPIAKSDTDDALAQSSQGLHVSTRDAQSGQGWSCHT